MLKITLQSYFVMIFKNSKLKIDAKISLGFVVTCSASVTLRLSGKSRYTKFFRGKYEQNEYLTLKIVIY